ncbi:ABC transporter permease [Bacillus sp. CGMCC 1.16607]|uniref:ABC transporter permease n=1 Tax=Bacillus sp. CGMCC 1.16607 TaxID=3351842 RepID=UPI0036384638
MNSFLVFIDRVKRDYLYQYRIIKIVLDWTIMLYLVVPSSIIAIFIYRSWWLELPTWSEYLSIYILISIAFLVSWAGSFRTFVKEADGIYFLKHIKKFLNMKKWAFAFSLGKAAFQIILFVIVALPFLFHRFSYDTLEIVGFSLFYIGLTFLIICIKTVFISRFTGWIEKFILWLIVITLFLCNMFFFSPLVFQPVYSFALAILFIGISLALTLPKVSTTRNFQEEVRKENEERLRYLNIIFRASPEIEKTKTSNRKKPLLFRQSKRVFKKRTAQNGFIELFLKMIGRNFAYLKGYFQMIGTTGVAIVVLPPVLFKIIILIGFSLFILYWISNLWDKLILAHPNSKQYVSHESYYQARLKANLFFSIPAICCVSIIFLVTMLIK